MTDTDLEETVAGFVRERMGRLGTPGVAVVAITGGELRFARGFGVTSADPEQAVPVTPRTLFRVGSTTKPMTGTLVMRLVEAGRLALDEPIVSYLPWFALSDPAATPRVTLRHLLSHQSGLPWGAQFFGGRDPSALGVYVRERVPRLPLIAPPGVLFGYSNVGINVAGCVAEAAGGAPFAQLMDRWVFEPLGMGRTTLDPLRALSFPLAQAHAKEGTSLRVVRDQPWVENVAFHPSSMAHSTVLDVANLARLFLRQGEFGGQQILSRESVAEMHRSHADEYLRDGRTVGLTFALGHYRGYRRVGHGGGVSSFGSVFTMLPEAGAAVIVQFNEGGFWQAAEDLVRLVFDAALAAAGPAGRPDTATPEAPPPFPAGGTETSDPARYAGTYLGQRSGLVALAASDEPEAMRLSRPGVAGEVTLRPLRRDLYAGTDPATGEDVTVGLVGLAAGTEAGAATPLSHVMLNGAPCARVQREPSFVPDPAGWHAYAGNYEGPDETHASGADVLRVRCEEGDGGALKVHSRNREREEDAVPWDRDCFVYRGRFLRFGGITPGVAATSLTLDGPTGRYERLARPGASPGDAPEERTGPRPEAD